MTLFIKNFYCFILYNNIFDDINKDLLLNNRDYAKRKNNRIKVIFIIKKKNLTVRSLNSVSLN